MKLNWLPAIIIAFGLAFATTTARAGTITVQEPVDNPNPDAHGNGTWTVTFTGVNPTFIGFAGSFNGSSGDGTFTGTANQEELDFYYTTTRTISPNQADHIAGLYEDSTLTTVSDSFRLQPQGAGPSSPYIIIRSDPVVDPVSDGVLEDGTMQNLPSLIIHYTDESSDTFYLQSDVETAATPEPGSLTLLAIGIAAMGGYGWRRKKQLRVA